VSQKLFLSYAATDRPWVEKLAAALARREWVANTERSKVHSEETDRARALRDLEGADVFVVVLSANANASTEVAAEVGFAEKYGTPMVAVRIDDSEPPREIGMRLTGVKTVSFHDGDPEERIVALHTALGRAAAQSQRVSTMELETLMPDMEETVSEGPERLGPDSSTADSTDFDDDFPPPDKSKAMLWGGVLVVLAIVVVVLLVVTN
jgi:hypothetical protein